ncbi:MAG TPA: hypothetical protein VHO25_08490 [Polyangiaceae bacterium]|nr:hypothetical protein [Polyangiaceae bacterium]
MPDFLTELHEKLNKSQALKKARKKILRQQARLKAQCSAAAWQAYLQLEETTNQREAEILEIVITYFLAGDD